LRCKPDLALQCKAWLSRAIACTVIHPVFSTQARCGGHLDTCILASLRTCVESLRCGRRRMMADTFDYDVFISYSGRDQAWVRGEQSCRDRSRHTHRPGTAARRHRRAGRGAAAGRGGARHHRAERLRPARRGCPPRARQARAHRRRQVGGSQSRHKGPPPRHLRRAARLHLQSRPRRSGRTAGATEKAEPVVRGAPQLRLVEV